MEDVTTNGAWLDGRGTDQGWLNDMYSDEVLLSAEQRKQVRLEEWAARCGGPHLFIDPAEVRIWPGNARRYADLTEDSVGSLIASIAREGGQKVAAVVRPYRDPENPQYRYEAITGTRRHWAVSYLRQHGHDDMPFVAVCRHVNDEDAFREADLENREREDVSTLERATNYAAALKTYYDGHQGRMSEALGISRPKLSKLLKIAGLPKEVISAFATPSDVHMKTGYEIVTKLDDPARRCLILAEAVTIAEKQARRQGQGEAPYSSATVTRKLLAAGKGRASGNAQVPIKSKSGRPMITLQAVGKAGITMRVHAGSQANEKELLDGFKAMLEQAQRDGLFKVC